MRIRFLLLVLISCAHVNPEPLAEWLYDIDISTGLQQGELRCTKFTLASIDSAFNKGVLSLAVGGIGVECSYGFDVVFSQGSLDTRTNFSLSNEGIPIVDPYFCNATLAVMGQLTSNELEKAEDKIGEAMCLIYQKVVSVTFSAALEASKTTVDVFAEQAPTSWEIDTRAFKSSGASPVDWTESRLEGLGSNISAAHVLDHIVYDITDHTGSLELILDEHKKVGNGTVYLSNVSLSLKDLDTFKMLTLAPIGNQTLRFEEKRGDMGVELSLTVVIDSIDVVIEGYSPVRVQAPRLQMLVRIKSDLREFNLVAGYLWALKGAAATQTVQESPTKISCILGPDTLVMELSGLFANWKSFNASFILGTEDDVLESGITELIGDTTRVFVHVLGSEALVEAAAGFLNGPMRTRLNDVLEGVHVKSSGNCIPFQESSKKKKIDKHGPPLEVLILIIILGVMLIGFWILEVKANLSAPAALEDSSYDAKDAKEELISSQSSLTVHPETSLFT